MVVADLHVHTTVSDGQLAPDAVPEAARRAGLEAVAITDHDRIQPDLDGPIVEHDGVTLIHGIELRVDIGDQRVDLLGYGVEPTPELRSLCDRLQRDRVERAREIADRVGARLDVDLELDLHPGVGRPHIARAIERSDAD
ncbi:MAG: PHP domain-containing protein, partial [Halapricum sp.]